MTREENLIEELGTNTKPELRKTSTLRQTRLLHERKTSLVLKDTMTASTKRREQLQLKLQNPCNIEEITRGCKHKHQNGTETGCTREGHTLRPNFKITKSDPLMVTMWSTNMHQTNKIKWQDKHKKVESGEDKLHEHRSRRSSSGHKKI
ncbi:hypothetical protein H5410_001941 [Solanum commersonii]|uniref:Uncharacterized protein n=1 Tax=Solanum commersonii TaxID=4109 RepID=A0A9J6B0I6_SOLCO|nr:hypothetical protein H5410_001941 [Solanum commersonii]